MRNLAKEKDPEIVRHLEHTSFMTGIDAALERLAKIKQLSYSDVLETHRILFEAVYPWAGQDRRTTTPDLAISKGPLLFAHPDEIQLAADYALTHVGDVERWHTAFSPPCDGVPGVFQSLRSASRHKSGAKRRQNH